MFVGATNAVCDISDSGVFDNLFSTSIINVPQSAVLGMHTVKCKLVIPNGQISSRPVIVVAVTYNRRLTSGREAVGFLGH